MLYTIPKCKECGKRTKKLYYHTNRKEGKKWIPMLYYCFNCDTFNGSVKGNNNFIIHRNRIFKDYRYKGQIHEVKGKKKLINQIGEDILKKLSNEDRLKLENSETYDYCNGKMVKLYGLFRVENKQRWLPVFWYCVHCRKVVSKVG